MSVISDETIAWLMSCVLQIKMAKIDETEPRVEEVNSDDEVPELEEVQETANVVSGNNAGSYVLITVEL